MERLYAEFEKTNQLFLDSGMKEMDVYVNGCLPWKTPLTKSIPVIMKSGNNCVSRRKNLFWRLSGRGLTSKSPSDTRLDKAVNYVLNRRDIVETCLEDGRCSFTNNLSENAIRPFAVGRKNWLFSSSVDGANASAVVYTMVEMAKAHGLNIYGYLKFLLENRPNKNMTDEQLAELAPWSEKLQSIKNCM